MTKMVVFDATMFLLLISPNASVPKNASDTPVTFAKERIDGLLYDLSKRHVTIIIPTPVLSEVFVRSDPSDAIAYVEKMRKSKNFKIEPFCERAALEMALMTQRLIISNDKRGGSAYLWSKLKFDRQIISIAKAHSAPLIYTDDDKLAKFARSNGIDTKSLIDLPIPDAAAQLDWINDAQE